MLRDDACKMKQSDASNQLNRILYLMHRIKLSTNQKFDNTLLDKNDAHTVTAKNYANKIE